MAGRWKRRRTPKVRMQAMADDEHNRHGCLSDLIRCLDFNQRFRIRKMLAYKRHGHGKLVVGSVGRTKSPKMKQVSSSTCGVHESVDENSLMEYKPSVRKGSSGKALLSTQNSTSSSKQDYKQNISPLASRLLRTISMRHRKGIDYIDNIAPHSEDSTAEQQLYSWADREHIPYLCKASDCSTVQMPSGKTATDIASQSKNDGLPDQLLENGFSTNREHIPLLSKASDGSTFQMPSEEMTNDIASQSKNDGLSDQLLENGFSTDREHIPLLSKASDGSTFHKPCEASESVTTSDIASQSKIDGLSNHLMEMHSFKQNLSEAIEALPKQNGGKELENGGFFDMIMILHSNRELSLKLLNDSGIVANYVHSQQISPPDQMLGRLSSFPVAGLSCRKNGVIKPQKSEALVEQREDYQAGSSSSSPYIMLSSSPELECRSKSLKDDQTALDRFKIIRKRIKDVIKDNKKEGHRISMDGVLHKIPYGRNVSKDVKKAKQALSDAPTSARYDTDKNRSMKRSHSLSESLDKYSRLFETISSKESKRTLEHSKSNQEDALDGGKHPNTLGRIFSLPEFESSLTKDVRYGALAASQRLDLSEPVDLYNFSEAKRIETFVHTEEDVGKAVYECQEQPVLISKEQDTCQVCDDSKGLTGETEDEVEISDELTKPSPIFDSDDPKLEAGCTNLEEFPMLTNQENKLDNEATASIADSHIMPMLTDLGDDMLLQFQVDEKDEADFNYVRDVLWKSGYSVDEYLESRYCPDHSVDHSLLYEQAEYTHEAEAATSAPKMSLEHHQLLFDITNEVLLEIYDSSFASCPWLSCFRIGAPIRPMPVGHQILEEVWGNVIRYLKYESQLDLTLAKNDAWMELQYDCEFVGIELEDLILQDLLYELVLQLGDSFVP